MEGLKHDKDKPMMNLLVDDMGDALLEVGRVLTFGAEKYEPGNWKLVEHANERYRAAQFRHAIEGHKEPHDEESGLLHLAHEACCVLFKLQLKIEELAVEENAEERV